MYKYSPIKTLQIKNFRNIGEATLDFTESPIISLIGENEAGKTSVVKAFATAALHAYARDQKGFIRDGTKGFGVHIELNDGSKITRIKTPTMNQYKVEKADGSIWDTNKIDSGLPVNVKELMGLVEEPETKEFLQVRTYEDKLLFVVTPASTNYKVMYDALKVDQLTKAIKLGSTESNKLKADINDTDASIRTLTDNLRGIKTYDLEPLINIKTRVAKELSTLDKIEAYKNKSEEIIDSKSKIGMINLINEKGIVEIDLSRADKLNSVNRLLYSMRRLGKISKGYEVIKDNETIDLTIYNKIVDIKSKISKLKENEVMNGAYQELTSLTEVSEYSTRMLNNAVETKNKVDKIGKLDRIMDHTGAKFILQEDFNTINRCNSIKQLRDRNKLINSALEESNTAIVQITNYLKSIGAAVSDCPNCGEAVVMDINEHKH